MIGIKKDKKVKIGEEKKGNQIWSSSGNFLAIIFLDRVSPHSYSRGFSPVPHIIL